MKKALAWGAVLGGAAAGALAYALKVEPYLVETTETTLQLPRLPERWNGLRVLFLSDPHVCEFGPREEKVLRLIDESEPPELILWGGDFLGTVESIDESLKLVEAVRERFPSLPMYAVPGNSEHKPGKKRRERLYTGLRALDISLLINEWQELTLRGETITIAGCDDPYYGWADLEKTFAGIPKDRFTLLLSHSPQVAGLVADKADLMLSGHTHGGQVRVPGYGAIKTQNPLSRRLDMGVFDREKLTEILGHDPGGDMLTFVGRGIGVATLSYAAWFAPRFLCRPEVAYLTLASVR